MTDSGEKDDFMSDLVNFNSPNLIGGVIGSHHVNFQLHHQQYHPTYNHGQRGGNVNHYYGGNGAGASGSSNSSDSGHNNSTSSGGDGDILADEDEMLLWRARRFVARWVLGANNVRRSFDNSSTGYLVSGFYEQCNMAL